MRTMFKPVLFVAVLAISMAGCDRKSDSVSDLNLLTTYGNLTATPNSMPQIFTGSVSTCSDIFLECSGEGNICTGKINFNASTGKFDADFPNGITVSVSANGKLVTWSASKPVNGTIVINGGNKANAYSYWEPISGDFNLMSPIDNTGNIPVVSHLVLCLTYPEGS